mmetsp:Transcript_52561/g.114782  ORF Transcript_52561/g.114782 Transcript_52561/m.114782 type:complete len:226 (-) Transcript_52561:397-1074(-)
MRVLRKHLVPAVHAFWVGTSPVTRVGATPVSHAHTTHTTHATAHAAHAAASHAAAHASHAATAHATAHAIVATRRLGGTALRTRGVLTKDHLTIVDARRIWACPIGHTTTTTATAIVETSLPTSAAAAAASAAVAIIVSSSSSSSAATPAATSAATAIPLPSLHLESPPSAPHRLGSSTLGALCLRGKNTIPVVHTIVVGAEPIASLLGIPCGSAGWARLMFRKH